MDILRLDILRRWHDNPFLNSGAIRKTPMLLGVCPGFGGIKGHRALPKAHKASPLPWTMAPDVFAWHGRGDALWAFGNALWQRPGRPMLRMVYRPGRSSPP